VLERGRQDEYEIDFRVRYQFLQRGGRVSEAMARDSVAAFSALRLYTAVNSYSGSSFRAGRCPYSDQWPSPTMPTLILPEPVGCLTMLFTRTLQCEAAQTIRAASDEA
jgi:hypothetical protein